MEGAASKQLRFGKACIRCRAYFVTTEKDVRICPWCQRIEVGAGVEEAYEPLEQPTV